MNLWLRPLKILVTSNQGGLIEVVGSAVSLHQTKKRAGDSLLGYFQQQFGVINSERFLDAQQRFVESLAGYSLFTHFAQVKDRYTPNSPAARSRATGTLSLRCSSPPCAQAQRQHHD